MSASLNEVVVPKSFKKKAHVIYKSVITGRIVSKGFAEANPYVTYKVVNGVRENLHTAIEELKQAGDTLESPGFFKRLIAKMSILKKKKK